MSVQRLTDAAGHARYKARIKVHGRQIASRTFARRADALQWEREQSQRLRQGEWIDPRRSRISLTLVAQGWLAAREGVKRRTRETDELNWRVHIEPRFGKRPVGTITAAEVSEWAGTMVAQGKSAATARRALSTFRSILAHAIADERLDRNVARLAQVPRGTGRREGQALSPADLQDLVAACKAPYADIVLILAHTGLRWGELAGLQVGDRVAVPAPGIRVQRAVLAGGGSGELFVDALKNYKSRTVPLTAAAAAVVAHWSQDRQPHEWLFASPTGTALREGNWKRSIGWAKAKLAIGRPTLRVHDLRHTAASLWLAGGADPKVVQRVLGHASATMTMDLYGHLIDANLWASARRVGDHMGTTAPTPERKDHA